MAEAAEGAAPTVTLTPTPSEAIVQGSQKAEVITDAKGRKLTIRKPDVTAQFMLPLAVGPEASANQTFMQMINPLVYLGAIDGEPVFLPGTLNEVMALIARLGDEGLTAVMSWYMANVIQPTVDAIEAAKKADRERATIKN